MNEFAKGFVAVFRSPLDEEAIQKIVSIWLHTCDQVEQVIPSQIATLRLHDVSEMIRTKHMQFRLLQGNEFAWAYITTNTHCIETTGLSNGEQPSLSLTALTGLPNLLRVIQDTDHRALDALEQQGLL